MRSVPDLNITKSPALIMIYLVYREMTLVPTINTHPVHYRTLRVSPSLSNAVSYWQHHNQTHTQQLMLQCISASS